MTAETDLDKPSEVVISVRPTPRIIHPSRVIQVKRKGWKSIFGEFQTCVRGGDITKEPTLEQIESHLRHRGLVEV